MGATLLCALAIVSAGWIVWLDLQPEPADPEGEPTVAFAESTNGRFLVELDEVALGSRIVTEEAESFRWTDLTPASGRLDTGAGRVQLGAGAVADRALTEAKFRFESAGFMTEGVLHELPIPQDTLRLRVPGEPGAPGDHLLIVLDASQSLREIDGLVVFEPFVSEARWLRGEDTHPADASADDDADEDVGADARPSAYPSDSSSNEQPGPGGDTSGDGSGSGGGAGDKEDVGKLRVWVRDLGKEDVRSLEATFGRVALDRAGEPTSRTFFDGDRTIDLRAYAGPEDRAELVAFQVRAAEYESIRFEFTAATADISLTKHDLAIPQPILVIEEPFAVLPGETTELLVDFSIEESVVMGTGGWEFRPVAFQFQRSEVDTDQDGVHDVADWDDDNDEVPDSDDLDRDGDGKPDGKPRQFRTGGSSLPTLAPDTGRPTPGPVDEVGGNESRPLGSEGSLPDVPVDDDLLEDPLDDPVGGLGLGVVPVWVVAVPGSRRLMRR